MNSSGCLSCLAMVLLSVLVDSSDPAGRMDLLSYGQHSIAAVTSNAIVQASEIVESVIEDLLVLDSRNQIVLGYLDKFDAFISSAVAEAAGGNYSATTLDSFYDIIAVHLDADVADQTPSIETMLIAMCLQRNGFDRWKRTVHMRTSQLLKTFGARLKDQLEMMGERRTAVEQRWATVTARRGQRKLRKLRKFIQWLDELKMEA